MNQNHSENRNNQMFSDKQNNRAENRNQMENKKPEDKQNNRGENRNQNQSR